MSDPFIGEIRMVGFNYAPRGWALCSGQTMAIAQNQALFALLGTTYGGNGVTTFQLPNYNSRSPVGMGQGLGLSPIVQGEAAGTESVTILQTQLPAHTHTVIPGASSFQVAGAASNPVAVPTATNNVLGASPTGVPAAAAIWSDSLTTPIAAANPLSVNVTIGVTGGSQPVPIRNPYLGTNFIIALEGIYPSRN